MTAPLPCDAALVEWLHHLDLHDEEMTMTPKEPMTVDQAKEHKAAKRRERLALRRRYAMAALAGMCAHKNSSHWTCAEMAGDCFDLADAMLEAEKK